MDRYETNSKGTSPALSSLINEYAKMPRSSFDLTRQKDFDAAPFAIIPVECWPMLPNSEVSLRYDVSALTKNPTVRRMLSSCSIELRTYYCRNSDLWEGWNNFVTRGRSGKLNMSIPTLDFVHTGPAPTSTKYDTSWPYNPYHYLNISPAVHFDMSQSFEYNQGILPRSRTVTVGGVSTEMVDDSGLVGSSFDIDTSTAYNAGQSALPAVMYAKIAKEYQNSNLLQNNPFWYPENENHDLILPYTCTHASTASYDIPTAQYMNSNGDPGDYFTNLQPTNDKTSAPWLNILYYRQRKGNYFNTGSPFPDLIRGDVPTVDALGGTIDWSKVLAGSDSNDKSVQEFIGLHYLQNGHTDDTPYLGSFSAAIANANSSPYYNGGHANPANMRIIEAADATPSDLGAVQFSANTKLLTALNRATVKDVTLNLKQWIKLAAITTFRSRMARTDGSYNQMIQAQFQHNPKWHEHSVRYCGGSYQPIVFSEVVQTSEDGSSPLGTTAGRAVSSSGSDEIYVRSDDYGIVMTVMTITPDDFYSQGIERLWSTLEQSEQYYPIMNNLEPQAILNKELFLTGTDSDDNDVFNYQERFSEYKSRRNQISGLMALPINKVGDTGCYVFNRLFNSKPEFNNTFVTGKMTDNENLCFASTEQAQFAFTVASYMKFTGPLPYVTQMSDVGLSY